MSNKKLRIKIELPEKVRLLMSKLNRRGFAAHAVGGCVRDSLMGIEPHDWDICTSATPDQIKMCLEGLRVLDTGKKYGTLTVILDSEPFEVTSYRIDGAYRDCRRPTEVLFVKSLFEDLSRRDFTINAMAYSEEEGLADPYGGFEDLQKKLIRCVGDPDRRFGEDVLRIIRALRFASVFGFNIEPSTAESIHKNRDLLRIIAAERINAEFKKLLCGHYAETVLRDFADIIAVLIPEIVPMFSFIGFDYGQSLWEHTIKSIGCAPGDLVIRLILLLQNISVPGRVPEHGSDASASADMAEVVMRRMRFENKTIKAVCKLISYRDAQICPGDVCARKLLSKLGPESLGRLIEI